MSAEFGQLLRAAMQDKKLTQGKTAALVGVYDGGRYLDATQVRLLMTGERKPTRGLVERLIDVLAPYMDPADAWAAAGLLPPGVTADMLRRLDVVATREPDLITAAAMKLSPGKVRSLPDRRRRDRRRLHVVPDEVAA